MSGPRRGVGGGLPRTLLFALALILPLAGCRTAVRELPLVVDGVLPWCCIGGEEALTIQYLGVGGWLFRMGDSSLLTAPFFSNPGVLEVGVGTIRADTAAIDRWLPVVRDVEAILVGHAHYDHLMDVPYIARRWAPQASIFGSRTAVNLLLGDQELEPERLVSVEESAGSVERVGDWHLVAGGRIRFMALESGHAPHLLGIHLYDGEAEPRATLPDRALEWKEGLPLAYLIDFLDPEGEVVYRVHYQDAAATPPQGFPPPLDDGISVDLAILCPPGSDEVVGYPEGILAALQPRAVLLGHWEDFFRPRVQGVRAVPGTDLGAFIRKLEPLLPPGSPWAILHPSSLVRVATAPSGR